MRYEKIQRQNESGGDRNRNSQRVNQLTSLYHCSLLRTTTMNLENYNEHPSLFTRLKNEQGVMHHHPPSVNMSITYLLLLLRKRMY